MRPARRPSTDAVTTPHAPRASVSSAHSLCLCLCPPRLSAAHIHGPPTTAFRLSSVPASAVPARARTGSDGCFRPQLAPDSLASKVARLQLSSHVAARQRRPITVCSEYIGERGTSTSTDTPDKVCLLLLPRSMLPTPRASLLSSRSPIASDARNADPATLSSSTQCTSARVAQPALGRISSPCAQGRLLHRAGCMHVW